MYHLYLSNNPEICFTNEVGAKSLCDKALRFSSKRKAWDYIVKNNNNFPDWYIYCICWHNDEMIFMV